MAKKKPRAGRQGPAQPASSDLRRAERLVQAAYAAGSMQKQVELARQALETSADCVDAYLLLADYAENLPQAINLYQDGVAAVERLLGADALESQRGQFGTFPLGRSYLRAQEGLANCLWVSGQREEAARQLESILELNPQDEPGIRYRLLFAWLELERHTELERLLERYADDSSATWSYTRALLAFRLHGDGETARQLLFVANQSNPFVPEYLVGARPLPRELPSAARQGSEDEAIYYATEHLAAWKDTPGATSWLRTTLQVRLSSETSRPRPWNQLKSDLLRLPREADEVWEVDLRSVPIPDQSGQGPQKLWSIVIASASRGEMLQIDVQPERPTDAEVWQMLLNQMLGTPEHRSGRPAEIRMSRRTWHKAWGPRLKQVGITARLSKDLKHVTQLLDESLPPAEMLQRLSAPPVPHDEQELRGLPQSDEEVWLVDARQLPGWVEVDGQPTRPWVMLVADLTTQSILATQIEPMPPDSDWLWMGLEQAMCRPATGEARRPAAVEVIEAAAESQLTERLAALGVDCYVGENQEAVEALVEDLTEHLVGARPLSPLIRTPGVRPDDVGRFFDAAAQFYLARPWRDVSSDWVVRVDCGNFQSGPWYGLVMGQSGLELGMALYEDARQLWSVLHEDLSDEESARASVGFSVLFGEVFTIAPQDADAAEKHGWVVAGPEAYPSPLRVNPGASIRAPLRWELQLLTGCLLVVPNFIHLDLDSAEFEVEVPGETLRLRLTRFSLDSPS